MNSRQSSHTRQSHHDLQTPIASRVLFEMTAEDLLRLFGDLNQVVAALQKAIGTGQSDLPTIDMDD